MKTVVLSAVVLVLVTEAGRLDGSTIVQCPQGQYGWYTDDGFHIYGANYLAGRGGTYGGSVFRDFFVFDLAGVTDDILGATLLLYNPASLGGTENGYNSPDASEVFGLFDVSTDISILTPSQWYTGEPGVTIYADLGSGIAYGSQEVSAADNGKFVSITLNSAAVSSLNSRKGQRWAVGGALLTQTHAAPTLENVFAYYGSPGYTPPPQLVLETSAVPEPTSLAVWAGIGLAATCLTRSRRKKELPMKTCLTSILSVFIIGLVALATVDVSIGAEGPVKYCRFQAGKTSSYGVVEGDRVQEIRGDLFRKHELTGKTYPLSEVKLVVPVRPGKVLALAGNYASHLGDQAAKKNPELFFKVPSCLIPSEARIVIPKGTAQVDPEGEMVIVIGKRAKNVPERKAKDYVFGVTCGNDVSARDWQKDDVQWWRAKGSDTFGPCGPFIATGVNYDDLLLTTRVNGEVRQSQRTKDLINNVAAIVSFASRYVTLEPGDLIYTGTPGKTAPIKPGDVVEVELENVGILRNPVVASK